MKLATNNAHFLSEERLQKALSEVVKRRSRVAPSSSPLASRWRSALTQSSHCSLVRVTTECVPTERRQTPCLEGSGAPRCSAAVPARWKEATELTHHRRASQLQTTLAVFSLSCSALKRRRVSTASPGRRSEVPAD